VKAKKNLVLTRDRAWVVEEGAPDGNSAFPVAQAGEEIPAWAAKKIKPSAKEEAPKRDAEKEGA